MEEVSRREAIALDRRFYQGVSDTDMKIFQGVLGKIFEKNGYQIYSLNFKNPEQSDRYNPFEWIQTEADMLRIIKKLA